MFGLVVLVVMGLYLWLLVWATRRGWRWGIEKKGWQGRKRWLGAAIGFLIVYMPVFWDFIPTVAVHQYYCAKDSGFWVYKTLDQWKVENPGVMEGLVTNKGASSKRDGGNTNFTDTYYLNQRVNWTVGYHDAIFARLLPVRKIEQTVIDGKTNDMLARYVDFSVGYGNIMVRNDDGLRGFKFWMANDHCIGGGNNQDTLRNFRNNFMGAKK